MSGTLERHIGFLADAPRIDAFRRALHATVRPGDVVVDIGAGTGILSWLACAAGARRVYAIEDGPIIGLARKLAAVNGMSDRIEFVRGHSLQTPVPEPADVVVSDLIGEFAFEPGIFDVLTDASVRFMKPGGRTIPAAISLYLAPAESAALRHRFQFLQDMPCGFDMGPLYEHARKSVYRVFPPGDSLLTTPVEVGRYVMPLAGAPVIALETTVRVARDGCVDALVGWFDAELSRGVHMTNAPASPHRLDRCAVALPISPAIPVRAGESLAVTLRAFTNQHVFRWSVRRVDATGETSEFEGSSFEGLLLSHEDLVPSPPVQPG